MKLYPHSTNGWHIAITSSVHPNFVAIILASNGWIGFSLVLLYIDSVLHFKWLFMLAKINLLYEWDIHVTIEWQHIQLHFHVLLNFNVKCAKFCFCCRRKLFCVVFYQFLMFFKVKETDVRKYPCHRWRNVLSGR